MRPIRRTSVAAAVALLTVTTAACNDDNVTGADPLPSVRASDPTEPSSSSTPTQPAWTSKYTPRELRAFEQALVRWEDYEERSEPIWRRGELTPAADSLFRTYFVSWLNESNTLATYEKADVKIIGTPEVLSSRPRGIRLTEGGGGQVRILQCVDYSTQKLMQNGQEAPGEPDGPRLRRIEMSKTRQGWLISSVNAFEGRRPCRG